MLASCGLCSIPLWPWPVMKPPVPYLYTDSTKHISGALRGKYNFGHSNHPSYLIPMGRDSFFLFFEMFLALTIYLPPWSPVGCVIWCTRDSALSPFYNWGKQLKGWSCRSCDIRSCPLDHSVHLTLHSSGLVFALRVPVACFGVKAFIGHFILKRKWIQFYFTF